jgi:hypothetical protein
LLIHPAAPDLLAPGVLARLDYSYWAILMPSMPSPLAPMPTANPITQADLHDRYGD